MSILGYIIVVPLLILFSILLIREIVIRFRCNEEYHDKIHSIRKSVYDIAETILSTGKTYSDYRQYTRPMTYKTLGLGVMFRIGLNFLRNNMNPVDNLKKKIEPEIRETLFVLDNAKQNAFKHGSAEAIELIDGLVREIENMYSVGEDLGTPSEIYSKINEIREIAQEIADARSFKDGGSYRDNDSTTEQTKETEEKDYYEILSVKEDATQDEIKKAYVKLAKEYHPDGYERLAKEFRDQAEERIKEINMVYSILSKPDKRKEYDRTRETKRR